MTVAVGSPSAAGRHPTHVVNGNGDRITEESNTGSSSSDVDEEELRSDEELDDDEETGLTHAERKRRRRRKQNNTMLNERIAGDSEGTNVDTLANASLIRRTTVNGLLIAFWYCCSISISVRRFPQSIRHLVVMTFHGSTPPVA